MVLLSLLVLSASHLGSATPAPVERPNIVLLLVDDQGWNGTSVAMDPEVDGAASQIVHTPALERLAREGRCFSRAYSSASTCAPTRAAIQIGRSPALIPWARGNSIQAEETTVAELLGEAGYSTAHFGKWHIEGGGPGEHGYDVHDGNLGNEAAEMHGPPNPVDVFGMTNRASAFMRESVGKKQPFFVQLSWLALHSPDNARPESVADIRERMSRGRGKTIQRAALAQDLDEGVGRLLAILDELQISDETLVIYTSDNGGSVPGTRVLRGGKGSLWEGGLRIPFVVRGPAIPAGSFDSTPIVLHDLYPTFAEFAGVQDQVPSSVEGVSLARVFRGKANKLDRAGGGILFHLGSDSSDGGPEAAIIRGSSKLVQMPGGESIGLFDLEADRKESSDLASTRKREAKELQAHLADYLERVDALEPQESPGRRNRRRKRSRDDD